MKAQDETKIDHLLLGFSALTRSQQTHFLGSVNHFLFASPGHRRKLIECWRSRSRGDGADVAECLEESPG